MSFKIGYNFIKNETVTSESKVDVDNEIDELVYIINKLNAPNELFKIVKNSNNYSTAQYHNIDIIRLKKTATTQWIKIFMVNPYKKEYIDSPLFTQQKNKNELFWISYYNNLDDYIDIINKAIDLRNKLDN